MKVIRNSLLALAVGFLAVGGAVAGGWDHESHGRGGDRDGDRGHGGPPTGRGYDRGGYEGRSYDGPPSGVPAGRPMSPDRRCGDFAPCGYARPNYPGYAPGYGPGPRSGAWRRGDFMPHGWDGPELDPHRYRLRTPPPGYTWRGAGRDAYLVQRSTGLVLDTAPGAW